MFLAVTQFASPFPDLWHNSKDRAALNGCIQCTAQQPRAKLHPCSLAMLYSEVINLENGGKSQCFMNCKTLGRNASWEWCAVEQSKTCNDWIWSWCSNLCAEYHPPTSLTAGKGQVNHRHGNYRLQKHSSTQQSITKMYKMLIYI